MKTTWKIILITFCTFGFIALAALTARFLFNYVPFFKQIGVALNLSELTVYDYFTGFLVYTVLMIIVKVVGWLYKTILNRLFD